MEANEAPHCFLHWKAVSTQQYTGCGEGGTHLRKNLVKVDTKWGTKKIFLGQEINTIHQGSPTPPQKMRDNIYNALAVIPRNTDKVSNRKWFLLLGTMKTAAPETAI